MNLLTVKIRFKVGTYEGTRRRDLLQRPVPFSVYTMGLVAGTSPLKGLHASPVKSQIAQFMALLLPFAPT